MFELVKKLFKKEKERIQLNINQIDSFLKENGFSECDLSGNTQSFFDEIALIVKEIKISLKKLEKAELRNPNIDKKAIHLMEGNRISYIKKIEIFINSLKKPDQCDSDTINIFIEKYKQNVESMNKSTIRSFYIVREFFKDNAHEIASKIKKIDELILKIESVLENDPSNKCLKIKKLMEEFNELNSKKESIIFSIDEIDKQLVLIEEEVEKISKKEIAIKSGPVYKELSNLLLKKEELLDDLENKKRELSELFSKIEPGLKKLNYIMPENKLIFNYLDDSINTLIEDTKFEILDLILLLRKKIESGEIDLKDKKKENILLTLNDFNKEILNNFVQQNLKITSELNSIHLKVNNLSVGRTLSEIEYKNDHLIQKKEKLIEEKDSLNKSLHKYDLSDFLNKIKINLEKLLDKEVELLNN